MKLHDLGFNEWFIQKLKESGKTDYHIARITSVNKGSYLVRNEGGEVLSELALKYAEAGVDALEINLSCPHSDPDDRGKTCVPAQDPDVLKNVIQGIKSKLHTRKFDGCPPVPAPERHNQFPTGCI